MGAGNSALTSSSSRRIRLRVPSATAGSTCSEGDDSDLDGAATDPNDAMPKPCCTKDSPAANSLVVERDQSGGPKCPLHVPVPASRWYSLQVLVVLVRITTNTSSTCTCPLILYYELIIPFGL